MEKTVYIDVENGLLMIWTVQKAFDGMSGPQKIRSVPEWN